LAQCYIYKKGFLEGHFWVVVDRFFVNFYMWGFVGCIAISVWVGKPVWSGRSGLALTSGTIGFAAKELHFLDDDVDLGPFLSVFFPGVLFEFAFDKDRRAFGQVLADEFGCSSEEGDIDEGSFIDPFAGGILSTFVDGDGVLANRHLGIGGVADLDFTNEVADED
jgi:hypothetical protein